MKKYSGFVILTGVLGLMLVLVSAFAQDVTPAEATKVAAETAQKSTLDNLQAAFNGESNAHARYVEFAKKADEEGYTQVASLFRAAARAEEIHAANHAQVIKKLGATPKAEIATPDVKSTRENLEAAITGESYEKDTMYPEFLKQARSENNKDAVRTFNFAKSAETEHATLYQEALANLDSWKGGTKDFLVCPVCGKTVVNMPDAKCPVCSTPREKFINVA